MYAVIIPILGELMKVFFILLLINILVVAQETYSIQVISVKEKVAVTDEFMQKISDMGTPFCEESLDNEYRIYVGEFLTKEDATSALSEVRSEISKDAFVCEQAKTSMQTPEQKMQQAMVMAKARSLESMSKVKVEEKVLDTVEPIKVVILQKEVEVMEEESKPEIIVKEEKEKYCKTSKSDLRESQIAEAISFYKNSSYYTFSK